MVSSKTLSFIIMEEEVFIAFTKWVPGVQKIKKYVSHPYSFEHRFHLHLRILDGLQAQSTEGHLQQSC